ncbi:MAG: response regulator [Pseudolabrys sp.]
MIDDLMLLKVLVAADGAAERNLWRQAAGQASVPVEVLEAGSTSEAGTLLKRGGADIVLICAELTGARDLATAAQTHGSAPLVVVVLPRDYPIKVDDHTGTVRRPTSPEQARDILNNAIRARMPLRAMIVDDSATMRSLVRKILDATHFKLTVEDAAEGIDALTRMKSGSVDLVFLDHNMPGLSGIETLTEIKREMPHVAVVMMTSQMEPAVIAKAKAAGVAGFLKKPFYPRDVNEVLTRHYGLRV